MALLKLQASGETQLFIFCAQSNIGLLIMSAILLVMLKYKLKTFLFPFSTIFLFNFSLKWSSVSLAFKQFIIDFTGQNMVIQFHKSKEQEAGQPFNWSITKNSLQWLKKKKSLKNNIWMGRTKSCVHNNEFWMQYGLKKDLFELWYW